MCLLTPVLAGQQHEPRAGAELGMTAAMFGEIYFLYSVPLIIVHDDVPGAPLMSGQGLDEPACHGTGRLPCGMVRDVSPA